MGSRPSGESDLGVGDADPIPAGLRAEDLLRVFPLNVLVLDRDDRIVYRNVTAKRSAVRIQRDHGQQVLAMLRTELVRIARTSSTFPAREMVRLGRTTADGVIEFVVDRCGDRYVASYRDVTTEELQGETAATVIGQLSEASTHVSGLGEQLASNTDIVSTRAREVSVGAEEMAGSIAEIARSASVAAESTAAAVTAAQEATTSMTTLSTSSATIGVVSKLITSIAAQTNLLALNATIEAARAGESGRGFAVVAGEVKELSRRTAEASNEIVTMVAALQSDGVTVGAAIERIVELISAVEAQQSTIAGAVEEQGTVAAEMASSATAVASAAGATISALGQLREVASVVSDQAGELRTHMLAR